MLQGHRDLRAVSRLIMSELTPLVGAQHGAFYMAHAADAGEAAYELLAGYGYRGRKGVPTAYRLRRGPRGPGGPGAQGDPRAQRRRRRRCGSRPGMGDGTPVNIVVLPVLFEEQCLAVIELASFRPFSPINQAFLEQIVETVGVVLNTIIATMRTEELLEQSQSLGTELQKRQEELQLTNAELEEKALELARQNRAIEVKNAEIELARRELEERAEQLALSSKYKSEFLANMSHELRTPLNSLLILAKLLADNPEGNLTAEAGGVRPVGARRRPRPAQPDQRHPRPVQGRGRQARRGHGPGADRRPGRRPVADVPAHRRPADAELHRRNWPTTCPSTSPPTATGCSRS